MISTIPPASLDPSRRPAPPPKKCHHKSTLEGRRSAAFRSPGARAPPRSRASRRCRPPPPPRPSSPPPPHSRRRPCGWWSPTRAAGGPVDARPRRRRFPPTRAPPRTPAAAPCASCPCRNVCRQQRPPLQSLVGVEEEAFAFFSCARAVGRGGGVARATRTYAAQRVDFGQKGKWLQRGGLGRGSGGGGGEATPGTVCLAESPQRNGKNCCKLFPLRSPKLDCGETKCR